MKYCTKLYLINLFPLSLNMKITLQLKAKLMEPKLFPPQANFPTVKGGKVCLPSFRKGSSLCFVITVYVNFH